MSDISVTEAAFAGVRAVRQRPSTAIVWYLASLIIGVLGMVIIVMTMGPALADLRSLQSDPTAVDPQAQAGLGLKVLGGYMLMLPLYLIVGAVMNAAAVRAILRPQDSGAGYIRFGGDEFRVGVVLLVLGLIYFAATVVGSILSVVILIATSARSMSAGGVPDVSKIMLAYGIGFAPIALILVFLTLKLSMSTAQTVDTRSINIFGSWGLSRGHLGKIFLAFLIPAIIFGVLYGVLLAASIGSAAALSGKSFGEAMLQPDLSSLGAVFAPPMLARLLIGALIGLSGLIFLVAPGASLYQQIARRGDEEVF